jgi:phosphohistidine phosphatase SixA
MRVQGAWLVWLLLGVGVLAPRLAAASALPAPLLSAIEQGEAVVLMRHALAPGTGDPPGFDLSDCSTQRNLSASGRAQARDLGEALRARGLQRFTVWTSPWCRCRDTAEALGYGTPQPRTELGSFFAGRGDARAQTAALSKALGEWDGGPLLLVTHQVNITALTGVVPASGDWMVIERDLPHRVLFPAFSR